MKLYWHVVFWVLMVLILTVSFAPTYSSLQESFYFVSMLLPVVIATCYFFNYFLLPRYLFTKKYGLFVLYFLYTLVISVYLEMWVITLSFILLAEYQYANMSPIGANIFVLAVTQYFIVLVFSFILLIRRNFLKESDLEEFIEEKKLNETTHIMVRENRQMRSIQLDRVLYIESLSDYVQIHLENESPIITKEKIGALGTRLPNSFIRIHRSFIINQSKITTYTKEEVLIGRFELPISRKYKKEVWSLLQEAH